MCLKPLYKRNTLAAPCNYTAINYFAQGYLSFTVSTAKYWGKRLARQATKVHFSVILPNYAGTTPSAEQARQLMHKPALASSPHPAAPAEYSEGSRCISGFICVFWMGGLVKLLWPDWGKCTFCNKKENQDDCNKRCSGFLRAAQSLCDLAAGLRNIFTSKYNVFCF